MSVSFSEVRTLIFRFPGLQLGPMQACGNNSGLNCAVYPGLEHDFATAIEGADGSPSDIPRALHRRHSFREIQLPPVPAWKGDWKKLS